MARPLFECVRAARTSGCNRFGGGFETLYFARYMGCSVNDLEDKESGGSLFGSTFLLFACLSFCL